MSRDLARSVDAALSELFGRPTDETARFDRTGVLHVAALWRPPAEPDATLRAIRIEPGAPASPTDALLLGWTRARADVVLTTGQILRDEPELSHELVGPPELARALAAWREVARPGAPKAPRSAVLTSGRGLPEDHPVLAGAADASKAPLILTGREGAEALAPLGRDRGIEIVALDAPGPRSAIEALERRGASTISIEAGPTTARALYEAPVAIDELVLSIYAEDLAASLRGPELATEAQLQDAVPVAAGACERSEPSGRWRFSRRLRRA